MERFTASIPPNFAGCWPTSVQQLHVGFFAHLEECLAGTLQSPEADHGIQARPLGGDELFAGVELPMARQEAGCLLGGGNDQDLASPGFKSKRFASGMRRHYEPPAQ